MKKLSATQIKTLNLIADNPEGVLTWGFIFPELTKGRKHLTNVRTQEALVDAGFITIRTEAVEPFDVIYKGYVMKTITEIGFAELTEAGREAIK